MIERFNVSKVTDAMLQLAVERSTRRGEEIKSVLLDEDLSTTMIERLQERTGGQSSCVQMFLCKISPVISVVQRSSAEAISGMMVNSLEDTRSDREYVFPGLVSICSLQQPSPGAGPATVS